MDLLASADCAGRGGRAHRPAPVELLVAIEVAAIIFAAVVLVAGGVRGSTAACNEEVVAVRTAIAKYRAEFAHRTPASLGALVALRLLDKPPEPAGPSASKGFVYDARRGTYAGGECGARPAFTVRARSR